MKKQRRKSKSAKAAAPQETPKSAPKAATKATRPKTRRETMRLFANIGIIGGGAVALGGGAWYLVSDVHASAVESDLSRIGNGTPTVVQIHDPQCQLCLALQIEARAALENFEEEELQYVVANIRQTDGRRLAARHGVGHVTLLLFDGDGTMREVLAGQNTAEYLTDAFRLHLQATEPRG
ncbi:MAG: hypothetical protein AAF415_04320 [Pseudomonadota bacterium]